ncbi:hypothetical protein SAMN05428949_3380 [Chitinophaga sp. YR627]|uniref:hypothetical protein n=1 Tax=Chitinophaga sp. YR627 TaxID=1881041 RepID=UPI0008E5DC74|nr:hypothetical protein [Chitinophaga sp. YR627]SFN75764.1 hypothetical protein SAMN05428949_3380 [Chitinophaga sp. YR627]
MKKLMLLLIAVTGFTATTMAQINVSINIGRQPVWGPVGYDHVDYYYLPDIECYYDVPAQVYVYRDGNSWVRTRSLPRRYANFDVYHAHKVVINGVDRPYMTHDKYRQQYYSYRGKHDQIAIRDSREEKYWANKYHPNHGQWKKDHRNDHDGRADRGGRGRDRH